MASICSSVEAEVDELEAVVAVGAQLGDEAGGGALRGRGGIVELVGQVAGQLAERGELFRLLLDAGDFAHAVKQRGDDALAPWTGWPAASQGRATCGWMRTQTGETAKPWPP